MIPTTANRVVAEKIKMVVKTAPKVSSSLAFKPRQTVPSAQAARVQTAPKVVEKKVESTVQVSTVPTIATNEVVKDLNSSLTEEFNTNSSYDVRDAYDPRQPNDYIAYCEERLERRKQLRLQEENNRHMQAAEEARAQLEQERRDASQRGDYQSLMNSAGVQSSEAGAGVAAAGGGGPGMGRGRGRGLNNLPAWMTQQLAATAAAPASAFDSAAQASSEQFSDAPVPAPTAAAVVGVKRKAQGLFSKPSCVLLLKNMVAAQEVDDQLAAETMQECLKYGPVTGCVVHTVPPTASEGVQGGVDCLDEERVRTFVEFERQDSAIRAFR